MINNAHQFHSIDDFAQRFPRLHLAIKRPAGHIAAGIQTLCGDGRCGGFGVLMYHRVANEVPGVATPTWNVTPQRFRSQLAGLLARGFQAWPLSKLIEAQQLSIPIPSNAFAVTFDDGYENNYLEAYPILRELRIPATIFLATAYLDSEEAFPFDDWSAAGANCTPPSSWRPLSTGQCLEMLDSGMIEFGAHTHTHQKFLGRLVEFRQDLRQCLTLLRERFLIENPAFAFPNGAWNVEMVEVAAQLDVSLCLTTHAQHVQPSAESLLWGRYTAESYDTALMLSAKLSGRHTKVMSTGRLVARPIIKLAVAAHRARADRSNPRRRASVLPLRGELSQA